MDGMRKKILLIAYLFPPTGGGGVMRALKLAKYLPQFGYDVDVLCGPVVGDPDPSLLAQLPDKQVRIYQTSAGSSGVGAKKSAALAKQIPGLRQFVRNVRAWWQIPDAQITWLPQAVQLGRRLMRDNTYAAILSTSGPATNHLVARSLIRTARRQVTSPTPTWLADFRDPWSQNMHRSRLPWRRYIDAHLERTVHREADATVTVTIAFAANLRAAFADHIHHLHHIPNGFDPADLPPPTSVSYETSKFHLYYSGILYAKRHPRHLLQAIANLIDKGHIPRADLRVTFAGTFDPTDLIHKRQLSDLITLPGTLAHSKNLAQMAGADVLLLIGDVTPDAGDYIPGKLYEYLAVGRPVLALLHPGEAATILARHGAAGTVCVAPGDIAAIEHAVLGLYQRWCAMRSTPTAPPAAMPAAYNRREHARAFAALIASRGQTHKFD
jgi:glycosyltransferase involved in cell wall biosynthesis